MPQHRPLILGLTGSIGMGKSTTAQMFRRRGVPVFDADEAVHRLYQAGGAGAQAIGRIAPQALKEGAVDRAALSALVKADPALLPRIEAIIHPLVRAARADFLKAHADAPLVVFDIPLLYETGAESETDKVAVVSASPEVQRARVLARPGMTGEKFDMILARQLPDAEKRRRADFILDTGCKQESTSKAVTRLIRRLAPS